MARATQPYRNSFSKSIGAGVGSLVGGSGKQYYILEHKIGSKYHRAGESQEIIVDQIEIGRDPKCQVRFDESFTTVSRRHAAIIREGDKWKLVQLSDTNPTFLNGVMVKKEWYLQNGDEIQFSAGGPKLGFIVPSGAKATVGTIGLSRRLSLFRQQALRPYKQAITLLSIALCILLAGSVAWGVYSYQKQGKLLAENLRIGGDLEELNRKAESLADEAGQSKEELEAFRKQAEALADEIVQNNEQSAAYQREMASLQRQISSVNARMYATPPPVSVNEAPSNQASSGGNAAPAGNTTGSGNDVSAGNNFSGGNEIGANENLSGRGIASVSDINNYSPYVFAIILEKRVVTVPGGKPVVYDVPIPTVVGTGFLLNDGRFITARHVMEPWYYYEVIKDDLNLKSYNLVASNGGSVVYYFTAISSSGKRFSFNSSLARVNRTTDKVISETTTSRRNSTTNVLRKAEVDDTDWAVYQSHETDGFAHNNSLSTNLQIGAELEVLGFPWGRGAESVQITPIYSTCNVARRGLDVNGTIMVSNDNTERGNAGGPVLIKNEGTYQIVGVMSGSTFAKGRIVPISAVR